MPLGITTHRRETSVGFATGLIVAIFYFLFIIIADTLRAMPGSIPSCSSGFRMCFSSVSAGFSFAA